MRAPRREARRTQASHEPLALRVRFRLAPGWRAGDAGKAASGLVVGPEGRTSPPASPRSFKRRPRTRRSFHSSAVGAAGGVQAVDVPPRSLDNPPCLGAALAPHTTGLSSARARGRKKDLPRKGAVLHARTHLLQVIEQRTTALQWKTTQRAYKSPQPRRICSAGFFARP